MNKIRQKNRTTLKKTDTPTEFDEITQEFEKISQSIADLNTSMEVNQKTVSQILEALRDQNDRQKALMAEMQENVSTMKMRFEAELIAKEQVIQNFKQSLTYTLYHSPLRHIPLITIILRGWDRLRRFQQSKYEDTNGSLRFNDFKGSKGESVFFYSLHKAGTSLLTHTLRQANQLTHVDYETMFFDNKLPEKLDFQKYGHIYGVFRINNNRSSSGYKIQELVSSEEFIKDKIALFMVRDPRDILISKYYSLGYSHVESSNPIIAKKLEDRRKITRTQSLDEFVLNEASIICKNLIKISELSKKCRRGAILKYEDLIENFDDFIRVFNQYISIPEERQKELFYASRPKEKEDILAHKRSGMTRQYKVKLRPETRSILNQILQPALERFNYPQDEVT